MFEKVRAGAFAEAGKKPGKSSQKDGLNNLVTMFKVVGWEFPGLSYNNQNV